jgi:hypothetical protein
MKSTADKQVLSEKKSYRYESLWPMTLIMLINIATIVFLCLALVGQQAHKPTPIKLQATIPMAGQWQLFGVEDKLNQKVFTSSQVSQWVVDKLNQVYDINYTFNWIQKKPGSSEQAFVPPKSISGVFTYPAGLQSYADTLSAKGLWSTLVDNKDVMSVQVEEPQLMQDPQQKVDKSGAWYWVFQVPVTFQLYKSGTPQSSPTRGRLSITVVRELASIYPSRLAISNIKFIQG